MDVSKSAMPQLKKAAEGVNPLRKHAGNHGRNTTPVEDHYIALVAKRNRNSTPYQITATASGTHVSARTISQSIAHILEKSVHHWSRVIHSDESRFSATSDPGHQLPWRERGTRYAQKCDCERDRYDLGVMVWASIMHYHFTSLSEEALHRNGIPDILF
ncbi:hypothetical protein TNCV_2167041 [Trichonephila clavipes]|nr:hypothetical protein TNCV_2167041 [Trichonephila clavipes]